MVKSISRPYRMRKRAAARDETRERIVRAAMTLHDEQGVATTSFADVAARAEVGPATVLRHFPTIGALVMACGRHVAAEMQPPPPAEAARIFAGIATTRGRCERLASELDAFYRRGALRLIAAANDRDRIPELDQFLTMVDAGIEALIRAAIADEDSDEALVGVLMALCNVTVWQWMNRALPTATQRNRVLVEILMSALAAVGSRTRSK